MVTCSGCLLTSNLLQIYPDCVLTDTVHTGCILILLFFPDFFSTLRASFEQLKARKSTRAPNGLCCYFCPVQCDSFYYFVLQNSRTSETFTSRCLTLWKRRWKSLRSSESVRKSSGRRYALIPAWHALIPAWHTCHQATLPDGTLLCWSYTILPKVFSHPFKSVRCSSSFHGHRCVISVSPVMKFPCC